MANIIIMDISIAVILGFFFTPNTFFQIWFYLTRTLKVTVFTADAL